MEMRAKEIVLDDRNMTVTIPIDDKPVAVVICKGKAKIITLPAFGETKIITHDGKVKRFKFDEGEEF
jgi:hypothetical protein